MSASKTKMVRKKIADPVKRKAGRPPTKFGIYSPPRIIGRVPDELWEIIKQGAWHARKPLSTWAIEILHREAMKEIDKAHK